MAGGSGVTISIQLRDSDGDLVSINSDTSASTNYVGTTLTATIGDAGDNLGAVDLGNGISIDIGAISTTADQAMSIQFDYAKGGNGVDSMDEAQAFMGQN